MTTPDVDELISRIHFTPRATAGPRRARALMIQGTSSDVGKSMVVAGLCRAYSRRGLVVRPFKAQNMSNNAAVADDPDLPPGPDGEAARGEIGRAQALQARACRTTPSIHMNPVLLKPQTEIGAQVVLRGRVLGNCPARIYHHMRQRLIPAVLDSFERLADEADLVLVEGAGSGAEVYLRASDITNMRFAEAADLPVVFLSDIDRGGTMAALVGSYVLLNDGDRARVAGYLINKFRGDFSLFEPGCRTITEQTGWPFLGVLRWFPGADRLPAEDSLALERAAAASRGRIRIAVPRLQRVANFDDLDPLAAEPDVDLRWIQPGSPIPGDVDVVVLPGSKATRTELDLIRREGWDIDILAHVRRGGRVVGLCAGFQMLGRVVRDPRGIEGPPGETPGLGLLDVETEISDDKRLIEIEAVDLNGGCRVTGYEMHMGRTTGAGLARPWLLLDDGRDESRPEGAVSADGRVMGAYLHGLFVGDAFRSAWLGELGAARSGLDFERRIEDALDALADHCEDNLDLDALLALAR
ncbi:adenosylcobyric acid synthase (glutamine-hydrolysing) [Rhodopseudomonas palustris HaA2]|uniref:Cobyric acid synthase n=1 Tax=Rhodopseudomonas palustris (strain HaA2) TaxID=316058 RepID=Q2IUX9_RHOP2|nr:cobyric acid synthase [Rhodopseudomonas palustris]ABD07981.1 adenosylcobyric acid synthase (glutamine-hydrolysing) [Rhodopseudomonas palustris HaA2]